MRAAADGYACHAGERHRDSVLQGIAATLEAWIVQVKREKAVYHTLNKCRCEACLHICACDLLFGPQYSSFYHCRCCPS